MTTFARISRIASIFRTLAFPAVVLMALSSAVSPAAAQCPGQWIPGQQSLGTIRAFVTMPNGDLYAGGTSGVFRWNGTSWDSLPGISNVNALANFNGDLVAGGSGGGSGVRRWNGTSWSLLGSGPTSVYALTQFNNDLIAGGFFTLPDGRTVARWDGTSWISLSNTLGQTVRTMTVYNGSLVVGGHLDAGVVNGSGAQGVGIWDGTAWHSVGGGLGGVSSPVRALADYNGNLVAGGEFGPRVAIWNGTSWQNPNYPWGYVWALAVHQGDLFAGAGCNCPTSDPYIHRLHNGTWHPIVLGVGSAQSVTALASRGDDLFVAIAGNWGIWRATCPTGDLNADGLVNDADQTILINVLLDADQDPSHVSRADLNGDDSADGRDIAVFTACRTGGCL